MRKKEFVDRMYDRIFDIEIEDQTYTETIQEGDADDEWDRGSTSTSHSIQGFYAAPDDERKYFDLKVPYDPEFDEDYYLLYAVYSSGDSFGHDEGAGIEYIGLYTKTELPVAEENKRRIEKSDGGDQYHVVLKAPSGGRTFQQSTPWIDYFGGLDYVEIETVRRLK